MFYFGWPYMSSWGWGWGIFGTLISILVICIIVRVIIRAVRGGGWYHHRHWDYWMGPDGSSREARLILDERYAKGEISEEEYKRMKENLK
jgi:Predicted membrane protein